MEQVYIQDKEGNKVLPITHMDAVRDSNGNTIGSLMDDLQDYVRDNVDTPHQNYVTVEATSQTTDVTDLLPAEGSADTIYRVSNWDGSQYTVAAYSEYAWLSSANRYGFLCQKTPIDEVFDISKYHSGATYSNLADALTSNTGGVPQSLQKGGMSIKFVQTSDNKYVQFRYMGTATTGSPNPFLDITNWQGVDTELKAGGKNLATSGVVYPYIAFKDVVAEKVDGYYLNQIGGTSVRASSSYIKLKVKNLKSVRLRGTAIGGSTSTIVFCNDYGVPGAVQILETHTYSGDVDEVINVPEDTAMIALDRFNDTENLFISEMEYREKPNGEAILFPNNGFIDANGDTNPASSYKKSDNFPIVSGAKIIGRVYKAKGSDNASTVAYVSFYNKNGGLISLVASESTGMDNFEIVAPADVESVIVCTKTSALARSYVYVEQVSAIASELHSLENAESSSGLKYHSNLQKPYDCSGKKAAFFGDSVTFGVNSDSGGVHTDQNNCYRSHLCDILGFYKLPGGDYPYNFAVSGSLISDPNDASTSILNKVLTEISASSDYDFIFIAGGINDFVTGSPLGLPEDDTYATFCVIILIPYWKEKTQR